MINLFLFIPISISFFVTLFLIPHWIKKMHQIGLVWEDMNKTSKAKIAGAGGVIVVLAFLMGVFIFIAFRIFFLKSANSYLVEVFALLTVILVLAEVGLIDDLFGWQKGGIRRKHRIILVAIAAIPLMAINAGKSQMSIPFFGSVDLSILYPLLVIPIGVVGASTTFNFLAGYNGLESGQGIIILSSLAIVAFLTGNSWLAIISLCMIFSLFAFLFYNFYPAKVFPGDSLTYAVGGLIAIMAVLGNFEKIAVFFFIPYIIETALKLRGKLQKQSFGEPQKDGSLELKYNKVYGLEHLSIYFFKKIGIKPTEKKVILSIWIFQIIIIILGFIIFKEGIIK